MASENKGLKCRAFLPFAVGGQAKNAVDFTLQPCRQSQTGGKRETMSEAAGREQNLGNALRRRMPRKTSVVFVEGGQFRLSNQTKRPERDIIRTCRVTLRQDEPVI